MLTTIGIDYTQYTYMILIISSLYVIGGGKSIERSILFLFVALVLYRWYVGILPESFRYACNLVMPCIISFALPDKMFVGNRSLYRLAFKLFLLFFLLEVLIAAYETFTHTHLLTWIDSSYDSHLYKVQSRPIGLTGAPLAGSHILACLSFFILNLPLKKKYKFYLWGFNFLGILFYQGRVGIVFSLLYFLFYMLCELRNKRIKVSSFIFLLILGGVFVISMFSVGFGSRLFMVDDGGSAEMRFEALNFFGIYSWKDYLLGTSYGDMEFVRELMGVTIVEIFVLCHFILFGILFSVAFYYLYAKLYFRIYRNPQKLLKIGTLILFFTMEVTSISWFSSYAEITFFFIFSKLLSSDNISSLIPHRYIDTKSLV